MSYSPHAFGITEGQSAANKFYLADANGDIEFQDSDKIIFGDGADASIYWDGSGLLIANQASQPITLGHASATVTIPGNLTVTGTTTTVNKVEIATANGVVFEGTANDYETTLVAADTTGSDKTWTLPDVTDTVVGLAATQTLTNKTLTSPVLTTPQINDTSANHQYVFAVSELAADRTVTLPLLGGADEFTFNDHAQTLTNKTLTSPDINGGTIDGATLGGAATVTVTDLTMSIGSDADGDMYYRASNKLTPIPSGAAGYVLKMNAGGTAPEWASSSAAAIDGTANGLDNRIATYSSATALNGEANLTFDGSTLTVDGDVTIADGTNDLTITSHDDGTNGLILGSTLVTASAAELNILDGVTVTAGQINNTVTSHTVTPGSALTSASTRVHLCNTAGGAITITLTNDQANGTMFTVKKTTADAATVTVTSSDNIDGSSSDVVLYYQNESVTLISDGLNYFIV